ncbi:MAG: 1-aminocyclopropane-1-carboxylate deaminase/D-cysteine desulfhydrase [Saprospiraceae bacterium]
MSFNLPISPLTPITNHPGTNRGISLFIKRDDLLHPEIQGSKGRKLSALFPMIQHSYPGGIVTFGGAFSNHLHAVATVGRIFGISTTGLIRGEHIDLQNPTLRYCQENGMTLQGLSKTNYDRFKQLSVQTLGRQKSVAHLDYHVDYQYSNLGVPHIFEFPNSYFLPEGGNTPQAVEACMAIPIEITAQLPSALAGQPLYLCTPAGTGCTAAGIVAGLTLPNSRVLIFPVSSHGLGTDTILGLLPDSPHLESRFELIQDYTFGGFAKLNLQVMAFTRTFFQQTNILLDPIYTAKLLFGVFDKLAKGDFAAGSTVVVLHTGGLQGWEGFSTRYGGAGSINP